MVEKQMKTFTAGDTKYIINDAEAREDIEELKSNLQYSISQTDLPTAATAYPFNFIAGHKYRLTVVGSGVTSFYRFFTTNNGLSTGEVDNFGSFKDGEKTVELEATANATHIRKGSYPEGSVSFTLTDLSSIGERLTKAEEDIEEIESDVTEITGDVTDLKSQLDQAIEDFAVPTQEAVDNWLEAHPEATTTVDFTVATKVFATASDMIADETLKTGDNVATRAYYAGDDNGGNNYVISDTHTGVFYLELANGLYANMIAEKGYYLRAESIGIKGYSIATDTPNVDDMANNVTRFQAAVDNGILLIFGKGHYYFNSQINLRRQNTYYIYGVGRELCRLHFPSSAGLVFNAVIYYNHWIIRGLGIESSGSCILCDEAIANLMDCHFEYLYLKSLNGNCFEAPTYNISKYEYGTTGRIVYDTAVQNSVFNVIDGQADNGAVFANIMGLGNQYKRLNIIGSTLYAFRNCDGRIEHLNTLGTGLQYLIYYDKVFSHSLSLNMKYVNGEGLRGAFIYTEPIVNLPAGEDSKKPTTANVMTLSELILEHSGWSLHSESGDAHNIYPITVHSVNCIEIIGGGVSGIIPSAYPSKYDTTVVKGEIRELRTRALKRLIGVPTITDVAGANAGIVYTLYGLNSYTVLLNSERHGENGTHVVYNRDEAKINELYGGKSTQVWDVKASEYSSGSVNPPQGFRFCDVIAFNVDNGSDKIISLVCSQTIGAYPGRIITIFNTAQSANNIILRNYASAGYGTGMFALDESMTLAPNSSMSFISAIWEGPNGNKYNAWKPLY